MTDECISPLRRRMIEDMMLGDDPVAEPRGAAGSRSNIIISVRRERPSSIVRPQPESCPFRFGVVSLGPVYGWHPLEVATAASRRRQRVGLESVMVRLPFGKLSSQEHHISVR
jgi:hypothetical protein